MLTPDDIVNQQELLAIYRRNLDHLLEQAAQYGGEQFAPLHIINSIEESRTNILRIKATLRSENIAVDDKPDDLQQTIAPRAILAQSDLVQIPELPTHQTSGSNQPHPTSASLDATSPTDSALPAPVFPTAQPTPPPVSALLVSNTPGRSTNVQIAVDAAGVIHVVWLDNTPRQGRSETVLYRNRQPDGTWSNVEDLTPDLEYISEPYLVADLKQDVCLVVHSILGIFTRCLENGSWTPLANPVNGGTRNILAPALSADKQLHWVSGLNEVKFADTLLNDGLAAPTNAQFAIDANGVYHVVWHRLGPTYSIEHRLSNDAGQTWQPQQRLSAATAEFAEYPMLVADIQGAVHLVWQEQRRMLYRRWTATDGWSDTAEFAAGSRSGTGGIAATSQGNVAVVWARDCTIVYAYQLADGTWSQARVLNAIASSADCADAPRIAIDAAGQRHIVWIAPGNDGRSDVFYAQLSEKD